MITEAKFKFALKEMMLSTPLEDINVTTLCKKCGVHRQTFYYHYQDIYDLIAAIFLNEEIPGVEKAKEVKDVLKGFLGYVIANFEFLRSTYNSAARDLTDDFIFGKINVKLLALWSKDKSLGLTVNGARNAARRFSHVVADEFGHCFKDPAISPDSFSTSMTRFINRSIDIILPAVIALSKKEAGK